MKRTAVLFALVAAAVFVLSGCPNMFSMNLFAGMSGPGKVNVADLENLPESEAIQRLTEDATSPQFYENLEDDPTTKEDLLGYLEGVYDGDGNVDTEEEQKAALLSADIQLKTTGGDQVVDNVVTTLFTMMDDGNTDDGSTTDTSTEDPVKEAQEVMGSLFQKEDGSDPTPEEFEETLTALASAADAYAAFGSSLEQDPETGEWNVPDETNIGSAAQSAMVSVMADAAVTLVGDDPEVLYDFIYNGVEPVDETGESKISSPDDILADLEDNTSVMNIMDAAGYGSLLDSFSGTEESV